MSDHESVKMVEAAACRLGEHFDSVQILVSNSEGRGTICHKRGVGNWYARQGMAQEFIKQNEASEAARLIAHEIKQDPE